MDFPLGNQNNLRDEWSTYPHGVSTLLSHHADRAQDISDCCRLNGNIISRNRLPLRLSSLMTLLFGFFEIS